jgi:hypothetical protein
MDEDYYKSACMENSSLVKEKTHFSIMLKNLWVMDNDNSTMSFLKWHPFRQKVWDINSSCHIASIFQRSENEISVIQRQKNSLDKKYNFKGTLEVIIRDACIYAKEDLRACLVSTKKNEDPDKSDIKRNIFHGLIGRNEDATMVFEFLIGRAMHTLKDNACQVIKLDCGGNPAKLNLLKYNTGVE